MMNRYLAYGNQFFVFVDLLNLFLLEDIKDMGARGAWKPLQGGCESVCGASMLLHISAGLWAILVGA